MIDLFSKPGPKMTPRPYQAEALAAVHSHICERDTNPCIVLPTGAGKSPVMAWMLAAYKQEYPAFRAIVLAHVKELVRQNAEKMLAIWPQAPIGVYSAGLGKREKRADIIFAGIASVYDKAPNFDPFDLIVIDEAHRIPMNGQGQYRRFIRDAKYQNPAVRVVGVTATPYRMNVGPICHRDHILNEICYEANVRDLIDQGYLCRLRSKVGEAPDVSGVKKRGGEYVSDSLAEAVDRVEVVEAAAASAARLIADRKAAIFFCVNVEHCKHVSQELAKHGVVAPIITGETHQAERDRIARAFIAGELRAVCNVNVLCEGFDATRTDAIVLLRPTKSRGLYSQMVGRGLRLDPRKTDCLVLDFAGCIDEHGPIDMLDGGEVKPQTCAECQEVFSRAVRQCPECGREIPKIELDAPAEAERERVMHQAKPTNRSILSEPEELRVDDVFIQRHRKAGSPDSIRVTYRCGMGTFNEWVCLDHEGYPGKKARSWWLARFGLANGKPPSVDAALADMFLPAKVKDITEAVIIKPNGKYFEVAGHTLRTAPTRKDYAYGG